MTKENDRRQQQEHRAANEETNRSYNWRQGREIATLDEHKYNSFNENIDCSTCCLVHLVDEIYRSLAKNKGQHANFVEHGKENIRRDFHWSMHVEETAFS
jgi:hypothetical protein